MESLPSYQKVRTLILNSSDTLLLSVTDFCHYIIIKDFYRIRKTYSRQNRNISQPKHLPAG